MQSETLHSCKARFLGTPHGVYKVCTPEAERRVTGLSPDAGPSATVCFGRVVHFALAAGYEILWSSSKRPVLIKPVANWCDISYSTHLPENTVSHFQQANIALDERESL